MYGYAFLVLLLFCALVSGIVLSAVLLFGGVVWKSHLARWLSPLPLILAPLFIAALYVAADLREPEWNPSIHDDVEIVGTWTEGTVTLELTGDHRFIYRRADATEKGRWRRDDWNLYLLPESTPTGDPKYTMRVIQIHGQYRIMTQEPDDLDNWDGDYGLSHKS